MLDRFHRVSGRILRLWGCLRSIAFINVLQYATEFYIAATSPRAPRLLFQVA